MSPWLGRLILRFPEQMKRQFGESREPLLPRKGNEIGRCAQFLRKMLQLHNKCASSNHWVLKDEPVLSRCHRYDGQNKQGRAGL
jgi:hypothetical protein